MTFLDYIDRTVEKGADDVRPVLGRDHKTLSAADTIIWSVLNVKRRLKHTVQASIIRLNVRLLHNAILDDKGVALGAVAAEDRDGIERQIKALGQGQTRICKEANL